MDPKYDAVDELLRYVCCRSWFQIANNKTVSEDFADLILWSIDTAMPRSFLLSARSLALIRLHMWLRGWF